MPQASPRLAVRALILHRDRLLLVNAWPEAAGSDLWCAPGGGVRAGQSLPENLAREVAEECGLEVAVGPPRLVNEFHDPATGFHQVEVFFRATILSGLVGDDLPAVRDPEGVVVRRRLVARGEMARLRVKPDSLAAAAWGGGAGMAMGYDPLEVIRR
ncbi:MAG: NUDIX domain-containing protein [Gemmobacter sp.]